MRRRIGRSVLRPALGISRLGYSVAEFVPGGGGRAPYLGHIATKCFCPTDILGADSWGMSRNKHIARDDITELTLVYPSFYVAASNVETIPVGGTVKATIEYPVDTFTASAEGTVAFVNGIATLTYTGLNILAGETFWTRALIVGANGAVYRQFNRVNTLDVDGGFVFGTGAPSDLTGGGVVANSFERRFGYYPLVIASTTVKPSVLIIGDSRQVRDIASDVTSDLGEIARSVGPVYGYSCTAIEASSMNTYLTDARLGRDAILPYFTHVVNSFGINDVLAGQTAATIATNRASLATAYADKIVIGTTLSPSNTSTDSWVTTVNQTVSDADVMAFNDLARAGIAGEVNIFDIASVADPADDGKWAVNGVANYATADGTHASTGFLEVIRDSGVVDTALIV